MRYLANRSQKLPLILMPLLALYGAAALTVVWIAELLIGSIMFVAAATAVGVEAAKTRRSRPVVDRAVGAPQFSRKTLLKLIDTWTAFSRSDQCPNAAGALEHAAYYRSILDDLDRRKLDSEAVLTEPPGRRLVHVMREKRRDIRNPGYALQPHEIDYRIDSAPYRTVRATAPEFNSSAEGASR